MHFKFRGKTYDLIRYPKSTNKSLRAWNAADELLLNFWQENKPNEHTPGIWNDRFGVFQTLLATYTPWQVISYHSQSIAMRQLLKHNGFEANDSRWVSTIEGLQEPIDLAMIRIPKSLDLFEWYVRQAASVLKPDGKAAAGFMTRHFSPELIKLAERYFHSVTQSRAQKKARLILLEQPKEELPEIALKEIQLESGTVLQQYPGVFAAKHVDPATQMLLDKFIVKGDEARVLDLGCGNGIIGKTVQEELPEAEVHLIDDFHLAVASAKLNVNRETAVVQAADSLVQFQSGFFDLVLSNPPFHLEHENNIEVSLGLFKQVKRSLRKGGEFQLVANKHLNYTTHLQRIFNSVDVLAEDKRFIVYACGK